MLWRLVSTGLGARALWGFEMKVSRSDWLKELRQPEKAESIMRYCNYWGLVVPNKDIVKAGELPETWGMYVAQKNRLKCIVPCPKLDPLPISMTMLTALAYAIDQKGNRVDAAALGKARNEGYEEGSKRTNAAYYEDEYNKLVDRVRVYEKASGLEDSIQVLAEAGQDRHYRKVDHGRRCTAQAYIGHRSIQSK